MAQATQSDTYEDSPDTTYEDRLGEFPPASDVAAKYGIGQTPIQPRTGDLDKWLQDNRLLVEQWIKSHQQKQVLNTEEQKTALQQMEQAQAPIRAEASQAGQQQVAAAQDLAALPRPNLAQPPKLQNFLNRDAAMAMAGIGTLIAGFNSSGKIRGIRANQSLAAGLNGFMAGNLMQAKLGLEDWKNQVEQQLTEFKLMRDQKLDILQASKMNLDEKLLEMQLAAAPYQSAMMQARVEKEGLDGELKNIHELNQMIVATERTISRVDPAMQQINLQLKQQQLELLKARTAAAQGQGSAGMDSIFGIPMEKIPQAAPGEKNEAFLSMLPPARADVVKKVVAGDLNISSLGGMGKDASAMRRNYLEAAAIYDPTFRQQRYAQIDKTLKESTPGGATGSNVLAINTLAHHIDDFATEFERLNNTQVQIWNRTKNKLATEFGDPALNRLKVPLGLVAAETARVVKGGRAAPTEEEIKYWEGTFDSSASPQQARQVVWQAIQGVGGRLREVESANRNIIGPDYRALSPDAAALIMKNKPANMPVPDWLKQYTTPQKQAGGLPPGGQLMPGKIIVINKATGEKGILSEKFFDPSKYDKVPEGQSVKMPAARGSEY